MLDWNWEENGIPWFTNDLPRTLSQFNPLHTQKPHSHPQFRAPLYRWTNQTAETLFPLISALKWVNEKKNEIGFSVA